MDIDLQLKIYQQLISSENGKAVSFSPMWEISLPQHRKEGRLTEEELSKPDPFMNLQTGWAKFEENIQLMYSDGLVTYTSSILSGYHVKLTAKGHRELAKQMREQSWFGRSGKIDSFVIRHAVSIIVGVASGVITVVILKILNLG